MVCSDISNFNVFADREASFTYTFNEDTALCGTITISLALSLVGSNDSDIFIYLEKVSASGAACSQLKIPYEKQYQSRLIRFANHLGLAPETNMLFYKGPTGQVRVSRRALQEDQAVPGFPVHSMKEYLPVAEGEIVQVQPCLTPIGIKFCAGEKLRVRISGVGKTVLPPVDQAISEVESVEDINDSVTVVLHSGLADMAGSFIILP
jgi:predicted acyl esterase